MFKVALRKAIYFTEIGDYENRESLVAEVQLPFAPYPGLRVFLNSSGLGEAVIESVTWFNDGQYFECASVPDLSQDRDLSFWLEDGGWVRQRDRRRA